MEWFEIFPIIQIRECCNQQLPSIFRYLFTARLRARRFRLPGTSRSARATRALLRNPVRVTITFIVGFNLGRIRKIADRKHEFLNG